MIDESNNPLNFIRLKDKINIFEIFKTNFFTLGSFFFVKIIGRF